MSRRTHTLLAWLPVLLGVLLKISVDLDNQYWVGADQQPAYDGKLSKPLTAQIIPYLSALWAASSLLAVMMAAFVLLFNRVKMRSYLFAGFLNLLLILTPNRWRRDSEWEPTHPYEPGNASKMPTEQIKAP
jgi:hypothetical protein